MGDHIQISKDERIEILRGEKSEFPKYTGQLLNLANQTAKSTRQSLVGDMNSLLDEFEENHPNGTFEEWKEFYLNEHDGKEKLAESAAELFEMIEKMQEAIMEIDEEMAHEFVHEMVLYKTFLGNDVTRVVLEKLAELYKMEYTIASEEDTVDAYLGDQPLQIISSEEQPMLKSSPRHESIPAVIYQINSPDRSLEVDTHQLSRELGVTPTEQGLHPRLDSF